jgi:hypothetical protein
MTPIGWLCQDRTSRQDFVGSHDRHEVGAEIVSAGDANAL